MKKIMRLVTVLAFGLLMPLTGNAGLDDIRRDAEKGDSAAQYEMGVLYEFGFKLADHEIEALAWYTVAAERGSAMAVERREILKARLSAPQVQKAEQRRNELMASMPAARSPEPPPVMPAVPEIPPANAVTPDESKVPAPPAAAETKTTTPPANPPPPAAATPPAREAPAPVPAEPPPAESAPKP